VQSKYFRTRSVNRIGLPMLLGKHLGESCQQNPLNGGANTTQSSHEASFVDGAELIENDLPWLSLKAASHSSRIVSALRGHRVDDYRAQMTVRKGQSGRFFSTNAR
jgi:hypothetical protein